MKTTLSFITANFIARELGWKMTRGWSQGEEAVKAWFLPEATFAERFSQMLTPVTQAGFTAIDLWIGHLHPAWATDRQIDDAVAVLKKHGLKVTSLAGYLPHDPVVEQRLFVIAHRLGTDLFSGNWELLGMDKVGCAKLFREARMRLAYENHPEASAARVLARIGDTDTDVLGTAVDTGWYASQGSVPLQEMKVLKDRIFHVHLKDIFPPVKKDQAIDIRSGAGQAAPLTLRDMGHETCTLGRGVADIPAIYAWLKKELPLVPVSLEHEPEDHDPLPDVAQGVRLIATLEKPPVRTAVLGCGNISEKYLEQLKSYVPIDLVGFYDLIRTKSQDCAHKYGGRNYVSIEELANDPSVELVINLTVPEAHFETTSLLLRAGKHVFTEKPFATTAALALELVELAKAQKLHLKSAPITFLGDAQQVALAALKTGKLGNVRLAYAEINHGSIETWHPHPEAFYKTGVAWDVGIYPLTLATKAFGPVASVVAAAYLLKPQRVKLDGQSFTITDPDCLFAVVEFASGPVLRLSANYYSESQRQGSSMEFHGDLGQAFLGSSYLYSAKVDLRLSGGTVEDLTPEGAFPGVEFARGVKEMASLVRLGESNLPAIEHAYHVIEVLEAIDTSVKEQRAVKVVSRF